MLFVTLEMIRRHPFYVLAFVLGHMGGLIVVLHAPTSGPSMVPAIALGVMMLLASAAVNFFTALITDQEQTEWLKLLARAKAAVEAGELQACPS